MGPRKGKSCWLSPGSPPALERSVEHDRLSNVRRQRERYSARRSPWVHQHRIRARRRQVYVVKRIAAAESVVADQRRPVRLQDAHIQISVE